MKSKNLVAIGILILFLIVALNEARFIIWGSFGLPQQPTAPNCGEGRYSINTRINSVDDFLNVLKNLNQTKGDTYTAEGVKVKNSISLFFGQKFYSVQLKSCNTLTMEISENGDVSVRGCCGI